MRLPVVDCRSLIEFCRAFEQHKNKNMVHSSDVSCQRNNNNSNSNNHHRGGGSSRKETNSSNLCEQSPLAALDIVMLVLVLGASGFLTIPYVKLLVNEVTELLPLICDVLVEVIHEAPIAYVVGLFVAFTLVIVTIAVWEYLDLQSRKCGNPFCKGMRKAVEFDIQLESEDYVKYSPPMISTAYCMKPLELGENHKELEAELKRMAPLNGRTVLILRARCGCPAGRLEVWGPRKIRRIKK